MIQANVQDLLHCSAECEIRPPLEAKARKTPSPSAEPIVRFRGARSCTCRRTDEIVHRACLGEFSSPRVHPMRPERSNSPGTERVSDLRTERTSSSVQFAIRWSGSNFRKLQRSKCSSAGTGDTHDFECRQLSQFPLSRSWRSTTIRNSLQRQLK